MSARDDFPRAVIDVEARRVAYRCSAPDCRVQTTGPSAEKPNKATNVGVGAHIAAARPNGPRYDPNMSSTIRSSGWNCIWLCQTHAKLIDNDVNRYNAKLLRAWKSSALRNAALEVGRRDPGIRSGFPVSHRVELGAVDLDAGKLRKNVAFFLEDIGLLESWRDPIAVEAVRCVVYEISLNAAIHAGSKRVSITSTKSSIEIRYAGKKFGFEDLIGVPGRGGRRSVVDFMKRFSGVREIRYRKTNRWNIWEIVDLSHRGGSSNLCSLRSTDVNGDDLSRLRGCDVIHLYPEENLSFSDAGRFRLEKLAHLPADRIVLHGLANQPGLREYISELNPKITFNPKV